MYPSCGYLTLIPGHTEARGGIVWVDSGTCNEGESFVRRRRETGWWRGRGKRERWWGGERCARTESVKAQLSEYVLGIYSVFLFCTRSHLQQLFTQSTSTLHLAFLRAAPPVPVAVSPPISPLTARSSNPHLLAPSLPICTKARTSVACLFKVFNHITSDVFTSYLFLTITFTRVYYVTCTTMHAPRTLAAPLII